MNASCSYASPAVFSLAAPLLVGALILIVGAFLVPKRMQRVGRVVLFVLAFLQIAAYAGTALAFSRVGLVVDAHRIAWSFGLGAFADSVPRADLESASATVTAPHGLGLRIEKDDVAYWLGGKTGIRMRLAHRPDIEVSCSDPTPVLKALATH